MIMNINNIIYLVRLMDNENHNELPTPQDQVYLRLNKPKLALVVDNTKRKNLKDYLMIVIYRKTLGVSLSSCLKNLT